jgi:hypothetical protein
VNDPQGPGHSSQDTGNQMQSGEGSMGAEDAETRMQRRREDSGYLTSGEKEPAVEEEEEEL